MTKLIILLCLAQTPAMREADCYFARKRGNPCKCITCTCKDCPGHPNPAFGKPTYGEQLKACIELKKPLIVGVRCDPPAGNWLTARIDDNILGEGKFLQVIKNGFLVGKLSPEATQVLKYMTHDPNCSCGPSCVCFPCNGQCNDPFSRKNASPSNASPSNASPSNASPPRRFQNGSSSRTVICVGRF